jgi:N-acetyl-anhydromuramyl-L-alanine amidase AmpD
MLAMAVLVLVAVPEPSRVDRPDIVDRPITFDAERERLTVEYRRIHEDPEAQGTTITPRVIVVHHTALATLAASRRAFEPTRLPAARGELARGGAVNVSAHFLVDRDGTIYRLLPETTMARHVIGLNHVALGIENVGGLPGTPLTPAQLEANAALVRSLVRRHPGITHLLGHHEAARMEGHPYRRERLAGYKTVKIDPGAPFMTALRARVDDLGLSGPP